METNNPISRKAKRLMVLFYLLSFTAVLPLALLFAAQGQKNVSYLESKTGTIEVQQAAKKTVSVDKLLVEGQRW